MQIFCDAKQTLSDLIVREIVFHCRLATGRGAVRRRRQMVTKCVACPRGQTGQQVQQLMKVSCEATRMQEFESIGLQHYSMNGFVPRSIGVAKTSIMDSLKDQITQAQSEFV